ncbi:uncharacterized protein LOC121423251 isoform X2 [Lytechinus variegatus]|uniref:uncharacterized protein LOC121423251 isoform X2 n=1 Tax=Lytechinus variegatus TaxID=7654 RepID=UPI001BB1868F|nr:uncharacterized protein LOC121423251 isoform X2 [Lytechinus variegatus]
MEPDTLLLIRWFRNQSENVVEYKDIICPHRRHPRVGDAVVMPWGRERWHGKVLQISREDSDEDDDDIPLKFLRDKGKRADLGGAVTEDECISILGEVLRGRQEHHVEICEHFGCADEVFSVCVVCEVFLCYKHFVDDDPCSEHNNYAGVVNRPMALPCEKSTESVNPDRPMATPCEKSTESVNPDRPMATPCEKSTESVNPDRPMATPCEKSTESVNPDRLMATPCEKSTESVNADRPMATPCEKSTESVNPDRHMATPCEKSTESVNPDRPMATPYEKSTESVNPDRPMATPCEKSTESVHPDRPMATPCEKSTESVYPDRPMATPCEKSTESVNPDRPMATPCEKSTELVYPDRPMATPCEKSTESVNPEDGKIISVSAYQYHTTMPASAQPAQNPERCEKKDARKRIANPEMWAQNVQKRARNAGKAYTSRDGTERTERRMGPPCGEYCRNKCNSILSQEQRQRIFIDYWSTGSYERQRDFICQNVTEKADKKQRAVRQYMLPSSIHNDKVNVCQKFFRSTLGIGNKLIRHTLSTKHGNVFCNKDRRGKHSPHNKVADNNLQGIRDHISSFQCVPSHYCRSSTKRKYLPADLSVAKMHDLYKQECPAPQTLKIYRKVFNQEFNLGFHVPTKDACKTCTSFANKLPADQLAQQEAQEMHLLNKQNSRREKENDKQRASIDPSFSSFSFDLQQVLSCPAASASVLYYKRKLSSYNFTVYDQYDHEGKCFIWNELNGKRGSCEIGTCLLKHLSELPERVQHVTLFSDCCGGQNRNKFIAATLLYAVRTTSICVIEQKFLESGHTHMEVDSMHSAIEQVKRKVPIYHPDQWATLASAARRSQPYQVQQLMHNEFLDLKSLAANIMPNTSKDVAGDKVSWSKIKHLVYEKEQPHIVKFRYNYSDELRELRVSASARTSKNLRLEVLYPEPLMIQKKKKVDLVNLCDTNVIPRVFHNFYRNLPSRDDDSDESDDDLCHEE